LLTAFQPALQIIFGPVDELDRPVYSRVRGTEVAQPERLESTYRPKFQCPDLQRHPPGLIPEILRAAAPAGGRIPYANTTPPDAATQLAVWASLCANVEKRSWKS